MLVLAEGGDPNRYPLPRALLGRQDCDFSFSGLKTAAARVAVTLTTEDERRDLAAAVQGAIARQLTERTERAMALHGQDRDPKDRRFVVAGGVAANVPIREMLEKLAAQRGMRFVAPPLWLCTDNGAMIAWAGAERFNMGLTDGLDFVARPRWPLDPHAAPARGAGIKA